MPPKWNFSITKMPKDRLEEYYASFGTGEAHGRAEMMEFNYLLEGHAITYAGGRYAIHYDRIAAIIAALAKELLTIEATGSRARAEALLAKYDTMPAELAKTLESTKDIPVDIDPILSLKP
jgi:predicted HAD superfamily phosphohydrolase